MRAFGRSCGSWRERGVFCQPAPAACANQAAGNGRPGIRAAGTSTSRGASLVMACPASTTASRAPGISLASDLAGLERRHLVAPARHDERRDLQGANRLDRRRIGVAGGEVRVLDAGRGARGELPAGQRESEAPGTALAERAERRACPQVVCMSKAAGESSFGRGEKGLSHRHRYRGAQERKPRHAPRVPHRRVEGHQRTHAVPDDMRPLDAGGIDEGRHPVGHRLDGGPRDRPGCGRGRAGRPRARRNHGGRDSAIATATRCGRGRRRGRRRWPGASGRRARPPV